MTEVFFYSNVENKLQMACTLTSKALARGMRVMLLTPDSAETERLGKLILTTPPTGFIPHCRSGGPPAPRTPGIVYPVAGRPGHDPTLLSPFGQMLALV